MTRRWHAIAFALLPLAPLGCSGRGQPTAEAGTAPRPVPVTVAPVERRTVERTVDVVGTLKGWEEVTIGSKKMGRVVKVLHDMGDRVTPGEPLVLLDRVDADLAARQSEKKLQAELAKLGLTELPPADFDVSKVPSVVQAHVALDRARQNLTRERSLNKRGAGTFQDYQNAENDELSSEAALENAIVTARSTLASAQAAKAALEAARQASADMEICAPVPSHPPLGLESKLAYAISKRSVSEGQMIREGDAVAELVVENPLRLWANVPERYSDEVKLNQPVRLTVIAHPGKVFQGRVTRINPAVDPTSRTFQVETSVPNGPGLLHPGGFAKAEILTRNDAEAVTVPPESIVKFAGVAKVFVVDGDKAREVRVDTRLEGPDWVEVTGAIPPGSRVVLTGQTQLADGTPVVVREPEAAPKTAQAPAQATGG